MRCDKKNVSKNKIGFKWILLLKNLQTINSFNA